MYIYIYSPLSSRSQVILVIVPGIVAASGKSLDWKDIDVFLREL